MIPLVLGRSGRVRSCERAGVGICAPGVDICGLIVGPALRLAQGSCRESIWLLFDGLQAVGYEECLCK